MASYNDLLLDEAFPRAYDVACLVDMPSSPSIKVYDLGRGGPILKLVPHGGAPFIVTVPGETSTLRLCTWPAAEALFALPSGILINTAHPEKSAKLPGFEGHTVHYVFPVPSQRFILVGHCCGIYCYDKNGVRWEQDDLFCCDDPIIDAVHEKIVLLAHKHGVDPGNEPVRKVISAQTGELLTETC